MRAAIYADRKLTAAAKADLIDNAFVLGDHSFGFVYLQFAAGQWTESGNYDGGPRGVGDRATYAFPDDHTLVLQEECCLTTFHVISSGTSFRLEALSETSSLDAETEAIANRLLYESAPFTLEGGASSPVIPDGTYSGVLMQVADMQAEINGDHQLTAADRTKLRAEFALGAHTTWVNSLEFKAGVLTERERKDGGVATVGVSATYAFPDAHTLVIQEPCCGSTTFDVAWLGGTFTLTRRTATQNGEVDAVRTRLVYATFPFAPVP